MTILIAALALLIAAIWSWHWVSPYWIRHDAAHRILTKIREEYEREGESRKDPWGW